MTWAEARKTITRNIGYENLAEDSGIDQELLDRTLLVMLETVCTAAPTVWVGGREYPARDFAAGFLALRERDVRRVLASAGSDLFRIRSVGNFIRAKLWRAALQRMTAADVPNKGREDRFDGFWEAAVRAGMAEPEEPRQKPRKSGL